MDNSTRAGLVAPWPFGQTSGLIRHRGPVFQIDCLLADDCFASGLAVTVDVLATANVIAREAGGPDALFAWRLLSERGEPVRTSAGLSLAVDGRWEDATAAHRMVFGVGMADADRIAASVRSRHGQALVQALRTGHDEGATLLASCSSTFLLAETGRLDGGEATTSWWLAPLFRRQYPHVALAPERLVTHHQRVVCAGAALAQLDLGLHLVRELAGMELAHLVARYLVIDDERFSQAPFLIVDHLERHDDVIVKAQAYARDHLASSPTVVELARAAAVSPRTLQRRFVDALGMSPASYLQRLRAEAAANLLRTTDWSVGQIAREVGYSEDGALRRACQRHFGKSPRALRRD